LTRVRLKARVNKQNKSDWASGAKDGGSHDILKKLSTFAPEETESKAKTD
jgi:hypothetical protein